MRPFPDPVGQQSSLFTLLAPPNLPAHARRKRETFTTAPGDPNTCSCSGPAGAPNTVGYKTTGNTNIDLYFKFTALYLQKRAGGKRLPAQSPRGWGVCSAPCSAFLFQQFLQSQSPPFGMVLVHSKPGAGEQEGPGRRARTAFPDRAPVVPHAPATPAPNPTPGAAGHASWGLLRGRKGMRSPRHAAGSGPPGGR